MKKMEKIRLEAKSYQTDRSGGSSEQTDRVVEFVGEAIGSQHIPHGVGRYTDRTLYQTEKGTYIVYEEHVSNWQGEGGRDHIHTFKTKEELQEEFHSLANSSKITEKVELIE